MPDQGGDRARGPNGGTIIARPRLSASQFAAFIAATVLVLMAFGLSPTTGGSHVAAATSCAKFFESNISGVAAGLTFGPQNRIWISEGGLAQPLLRGISPAGGADVVYPLGDVAVTGMYDPQGLAVDGDGRIWIAGGPLGQKIARIDPATGIIASHPLAGAPMRVARGADGNLWVTLRDASAIAKVSTAGVVLATYPLASGARPLDITAATDGALWFTETGAPKIGRLTTTGELTEYSISALAWSITSSGSDIWFTERDSSNVGHLNIFGLDRFEVATPTAAAGPLGLAVGADGGVWFTEHDVAKIGRLDPVRIDPVSLAHVIDETLITTSSSPPGPMIAVPDGTIWFAIEVNHLEHFKPNADGTVGPLPPSVALSAGSPVQSTPSGLVYSTSTVFTIGASRPDVCIESVSYRIYAAGTLPGPFQAPVVLPATVNFTLGDGTWVVEFSASGPGGQSLIQRETLVIDQSRFARDTVPPLLTLPGNITLAATSVAGATVTYAVAATDAVDGPITASCSPASGSTFPLAVTTTVRCTASDRTGNATSGSFTVTVTAGPPLVTVPADLVLRAVGASTSLTFTAAALSPWGGSLGVTCSPSDAPRPSPATFTLAFPPDVTTVVTCRSAPDGIAHTGGASFTVTTVTPPVLHLPSSLTVPATGTMTPVAFSVTATNAASASVPVTCTPVSGSAFPVGTTTVSCSATDRGVISTGTFTVTVVALPPVGETQFVIWGGNARGVQIGQHVVFWGEHWWDNVDLPRSSRVADFKGWAATVTGASWSSRSGNSKPPKAVPAYISVIITTSIERSNGDGDRITGNIVGRAILQVDSSYRGEPSRPVSGVVVAFVP